MSMNVSLDNQVIVSNFTNNRNKIQNQSFGANPSDKVELSTNSGIKNNRKMSAVLGILGGLITAALLMKQRGTSALSLLILPLTTALATYMISNKLNSKNIEVKD